MVNVEIVIFFIMSIVVRLHYIETIVTSQRRR